MTTKPKARKFRLRRGTGEGVSQSANSTIGGTGDTDQMFAPPPNEDGFAGMDFRKDSDRPAPSQSPSQAPSQAPSPRQAQRAAQQPQARGPHGQGAQSQGAQGQAPHPQNPRDVQPNRPQRPANPAQAGGTQPRAAAQVVRNARKPDPQQMSDLTPEQEIEAIRAEDLTGRQLRIARRVAQRNGMNPVSDLDAVRMLRQAGIDPFARENMLQLVAAENGAGKALSTGNSPASQRTQLPQTVPQNQPPAKQQPAPPPPGQPQIESGAEVAKEVRRIQKDIVRRRRKRMGLLFARLLFFVTLPTILSGLYYYRYATPMYATNSQFVIQQADSSAGGAGGGFGSMFSGTMLATTQDAVTVQSYLQSRDAMLRLNADMGFKDHFSSETLDPLQRLEPDASNEAAYKVYKRHVKIGFDPTEGIVKMEVIAADPETSQAFAQALLSYAEEQVDNLTQRLREDQMSGARDSYEEAELRMLEAQQRVIALQEQRGVLSAEAEASSLMSQISTFEVEVQNERLRLAELQQNANPNPTRVAVARGNISRLEQLVVDLRAKLTEGGVGGTASLARISGELMVAEQDLQTRTLLLQQSLQQLETARIEANRQVRYLSLGVTPVAPDEASYPRAFENTLLALMIFGGIYLMLSLTASILREQVSG